MSIRSKLETDRATRVPFAPSSDIPQTDVQRAIEAVQAAVAALNAALAAPQYLVGAATSDLSAERVVTDTSTIAWDLATAGQAKAGIVGKSVSGSQLADTAVTPGSYGSASAVATFTVDQQGRLTAAGSSNISIAISAVAGLQTALDAKALAATTLTAGAGLTGGGDLSTNRTFAVGAGTGITVNADDVALDTASTRNTDHASVTLTAGAGLTGGGDITSSRTLALDTASTRNTDHSGVTLTAGNGLTGGGDISASRSFAVGAGTGIVANADDIAIDKASDANVRTAASNKVLTSDLLNSSAGGVALSDAATVSVDWTAGINFTLTVTANRAIGNPTNGIAGQWRTILVQGNDGTSRTITFGANYLGDIPTITDCTSTKQYLLMIYCVSSSWFVVSSKQAK